MWASGGVPSRIRGAENEKTGYPMQKGKLGVGKISGVHAELERGTWVAVLWTRILCHASRATPPTVCVLRRYLCRIWSRGDILTSQFDKPTPC